MGIHLKSVASEVENTPAGNVSAQDLQSAVNELDEEKLALTGGTMTGDIILPANPNTSLGAIPKQYVDKENYAGLISGTTTLTAADTGKTFVVNSMSADYAITLPTPAAGLRFKFFGTGGGFRATLSFSGYILYWPGGAVTSPWGHNLASAGAGVEIWSEGSAWFVQMFSAASVGGAAYLAAAQTIPATTWTKVNISAALGGAKSTIPLASGSFTIKKSAYCDITARVKFDSSVSADTVYVYIGFNGAIYDGDYWTFGAQWRTYGIRRIAHYLAAGTTVELFTYSAVGRSIPASSQTHLWIEEST